MVMTSMTAAVANYYYQKTGLEARPDLADGIWFNPSNLFNIADGASVDRDRLRERLEPPRARAGAGIKPRKHAQRYGTDFVFSAPKSLSLIWAFGATETREIIETGMYEAAKSAVDILLREATYERVGSQGSKLLPARGIAALFFHIASRHAEHEMGKRFPDPNIHIHAIVSEIVLGETNIEKVAYKTVWGRWAMALGAWFHACLAGHMFQAGFDVKPTGNNGSFSIEGIPTEICRAFSARTFGAKGLNGKAPLRIIPLNQPAPVAQRRPRGRPKKVPLPAPMQIAAEELQIAWRDFASELQLDVSYVEARAEKARDECSLRIALTAQGRARSEARLSIGVAKLAQAKPVLQKQDLVQAFAGEVVDLEPMAPDWGAFSAAVRDLPELMPLKPTRSYAFEQWSTWTAYERELNCRKLVDQLLTTRARLHVDMDEAEMEGPNEGQRNAAKLAASDKRIVLIEGGAGTGKTHLLQSVIEAHKTLYPQVEFIACAEAWLTAVALRDQCKIDGHGYSLAKFFVLLWKPEEKRGFRFDRNTILIVDEVGLVSVARMQAILSEVVRRGAKLILVGDEAQLEPIGGGSGIRLLKSMPGLPIASLSENMRAKDETQLEAVERFRSHDFDGFYKTLAAKKRWVSVERSEKEPLADWRKDAQSRAHKTVCDKLMAGFRAVNVSVATRETSLKMVGIAKGNADAIAISRQLRHRMRHEGLLENAEYNFDAVTPSGDRYKLSLSVGDYVRFLVRVSVRDLEKNGEIDVFNGTNAKITAIEQVNSRHKISAVIESQKTRYDISFIAEDLSDKQGLTLISWNYFRTIFGSQGATYDDTILFVDENWNYRDLYVALTRARQVCTIVHFAPSRTSLARGAKRFAPAMVKKRVASIKRSMRQGGDASLVSDNIDPDHLPSDRRSASERGLVTRRGGYAMGVK